MSKLRQQVREFMVASRQALPSCPYVPPEDVVRLRLSLVVEEVRELTDACIDSDHQVRVDLVEVADALADIDYVVEGMRQAFGIDGGPVADEVHASNMRKFGPGAWVREDGKWMKPPDWVPPDIRKKLIEQGWVPPEEK